MMEVSQWLGKNPDGRMILSSFSRSNCEKKSLGSEIFPKKYFSTPCSSMMNVLQWWRNFLIWQSFAKAIWQFRLPALQVKGFSLLPGILSQQSSLHPAHIDALIFLHANQDRKSKTVTGLAMESE